MRLKVLRQQGLALIITLLTMVVVAGIGTLLFMRTVSEVKHSGDDAAIVQTLLLARGGANLGAALLTSDLRDELNNIVKVRSSTTTCWSFGTGFCDAMSPNPASVVSALTGADSVASQLQDRIDSTLCEADLNTLGDGSLIKIRVFVTDESCGDPLPSGIELPSGRFVAGSPRPENQDYAIPFVLVSEAKQGTFKRNVVLQGEYRFTVGRVTFAQYALFTNYHKNGTGSRAGDIWFSSRSLFDGPVHTNEYLRFSNEPWFGHQVTSVGCPAANRTLSPNIETGAMEQACTGANPGAYFNDAANTLRLADELGPSPQYDIHKPTLAGSVDWRAEFVPLPTNSFEQADEASRGGINYGPHATLLTLDLWAASADGKKLNCNSSGVCNNEAAYQYIEADVLTCTRYRSSGSCRDSVQHTVTHRFGPDGVLYQQNSDMSWSIAKNASGINITNFNGVIYADKGVPDLRGPARTDIGNRLSSPPAIASFAQMTIATEGDVKISRDIKYETPTCSTAPSKNYTTGVVTPATCENTDTLNVLGIYTQKGEIVFANPTTGSGSRTVAHGLRNLTVHAVLMSSAESVRVENHDVGGERGSIHLLGGIIENYYGPSGTFNSRTGLGTNGYGRSYTYDPRMYSTVSPPYFPTIGLDRVKGVMVYSFGQREQVY